MPGGLFSHVNALFPADREVHHRNQPMTQALWQEVFCRVGGTVRPHDDGSKNLQLLPRRPIAPILLRRKKEHGADRAAEVHD